MAKCPNCRNIVADTAGFCSECGQYLDAVGGNVSTDGSTVTATSSSDKNMYYVGVVLGILGVAFFGYFFFLIALPEAILQLFWGKSVLDSLSKDARENPALRGSFLAMRWFGNFLLLVIALAIVVGVLFLLGALV